MPVRRWLTVLGALLAALVVVLAGVVALALHKRSADAIEAQRPAVLSSAERFAVALSSLSSEGDKSGMDGLKELSTEAYKITLNGQAAALHLVFQVGDVRSQGRVVVNGIERIDRRAAVTLTSVETQVSDLKVPQGEVRKYRLAITLERNDDRWLVSAVDMVR